MSGHENFDEKVFGSRHSRMDQVKFVEDSLITYHNIISNFKGCLPQISLGPFWNTLTQLIMRQCQMFS